MEEFEKIVNEFVSLAKEKGYSRKAAEIICAICCSEQTYKLGYTDKEVFGLATKYCKMYDDERECINKLIEIIK